jgi:hypothetical protein
MRQTPCASVSQRTMATSSAHLVRARVRVRVRVGVGVRVRVRVRVRARVRVRVRARARVSTPLGQPHEEVDGSRSAAHGTLAQRREGGEHQRLLLGERRLSREG